MKDTEWSMTKEAKPVNSYQTSVLIIPQVSGLNRQVYNIARSIIMQNKPIFKPSKMKLSPYILMPNANCLMPVTQKNKPNRTQTT